MGGYGSGRRLGRGYGTVERWRSLDVNRLHREGCLRPGCSGSLEWTSDGDQVASIGFRAEENQLHLNYRFQRDGGEWETVDEPVRIVRIPCRYGGTRPYLICPGVVNGVTCGRRVVKLHGADRYFLCRHCYRLSHASQGEADMDRARRRAIKIRERLGGDTDLDGPLPPRPKGMWRRTYERLQQELINAETEAEEAFELQAARLMTRILGKSYEESSWKRSFWT